MILFLSCLLFNLISCKTCQKVSADKTLIKIDSANNVTQKLYLLKNKKLEVSESNGYLTYKIVASDKTNVIQFLYEKDLNQIAYDGGYREELIFEIPTKTISKSYTNDELQITKMLFGRYCNCRGKNGLFKVNNGKLQINSSKKQTRFQLQFKINEVPQVISEIKY